MAAPTEDTPFIRPPLSRTSTSSSIDSTTPLQPRTSANVEAPEPTVQSGVAEAEAVTAIWTRKDLFVAYGFIWFIYFVDTLQQSTTSNLLPWVTSDFAAHELTATTSVLSYLISGLSKLTLAKILDIWGRPQGYALCIGVLTAGLVLMATCHDVKQYCAGQIFYWVGYNGLSYTLTVFIADTSALKNRSLMFAFSLSPYLITTWIGGFIATAFLNGPGWRWAYGLFAFLTPAATLPLFYVFRRNRHKAKQAGLIEDQTSDRTWLESLRYYALEFDVVGLSLVTLGLGLFLLPFSLVAHQPDGWRTWWVGFMIAIGIVLLGVFALYESLYAHVKFLPYNLLSDRTIAGAFIVCVINWIQFYVWGSYFSSFLQVVMDLDIVKAGYIGNIYTIGSCLWSLVTGIIIRRTGRFRPVALWLAVPLTLTGSILMIWYRQPGASIFMICFCQALIAFAGGTLNITEEIAVMAVVPHQYIAVLLAMLGMFTSVGGAVGSTVAAAIWQAVFPRKLEGYLPEGDKHKLEEIIGSIAVQKSYAVGTPVRMAIERAYGDAQRVMLIASATISVGIVAAILMWRDVNVKDRRQVPGVVI